MPRLLELARHRTLPQNLALQPFTTFEDYEDATDWTVLQTALLTDDTTNYKTGVAGLNVDTNGGSKTAGGTKTVVWDLSGYSCIRCWVYLVNETNLTSVSWMLANEAAFNNYFLASVNAAALRPGWNLVQIPMSSFSETGTPSWATIVRFRTRVTSGAGGSAVATFDTFAAGILPLPVCIIRIDDGWDDVWDEFLPIMRPLGFRGTCYVPSSKLGGANALTVAQASALHALGWDIANHGDGTNLGGQTQAAQEGILDATRDELVGYGFTRSATHVSYPQSSQDANTLLAMAAQSMLTGSLSSGLTAMYEVLPLAQAYVIENSTKALSSSIALSDATGYLDTAIANGRICIFLGHKLAAAADATTWVRGDFRALCEYIAAKRVPVITISELHALQNGPITVAGAY